MQIIHIASELAPIAKAGGLGDVVYGLSQELQRLGHHVEVILPKYDCIDFSHLKDVTIEEKELFSLDGTDLIANTVWSAQLENLNIKFIEPHHPGKLFNRGAIYGSRDDIDRFTYFCGAAIAYLFKMNKQPDILHLHDWPTALIAVLYKEMYAELGYHVEGTVLTIHNLEHQGRCSPTQLSRAGLQAEAYLSPDKMQDPQHPMLINLLKGGIVYADQVTTVSPNYEKEIQTPEGGFALNSTLINYQHKLSGILNGIDETFWTPCTDRYLAKQYETHNIRSTDHMAPVLAGKKENKYHLRRHVQLEDSDQPIVACVTRLVPQKSPRLIKAALQRTLEKGGQFVLLGSSPIPEIIKEFQALQEQHAHNRRVAILIDKDEALAHQIFAGADMVVIPSLFEPCGLTQLISLRYGTVPIARLTGGLADTVFDIDTSEKPYPERNGFTFEYPDEQGVYWALDRALACFINDPNRWHELMRNGMQYNFTWKKPALEYANLYQNICSKHTATVQKE